ncbi:MAG TPA: hypothetical protein VE732_07185 [Nitrososphaera sp.]|nr:hypothetical protein [Nitrososphaera sp.]
MQLNPKASQSYNERANTLFPHLTARPSQPPRTSVLRFVPDAHVTATIPIQDIIGEIKMMRRDREGNEAGKGFYHEGQTVELIGEGYQILKKIAVGIHKAPDLHRSVSVTFLIDHIFDWIKESYKRATILPMTEYVLMECEKSIKEYEVWIPIASTHIESEFHFGKMKIKTITREMLDRWEVEFRQTHPEMLTQSDEFFIRWRKKVLGLAAATMKLKAEPKRAYELASSEAERTLAILRCLSPQNCFPFVVSYSVPLGHEGSRSFQYLMTQEDKVVFSTSGIEQTPFDRWTIDNEYMAEMKQFGLDTLDTLLKVQSPTAFQRTVLDALQLYGRSSTLRESADKLTYILTPLEALLLLNKTQSPEDLAERLALLVDRTLESRKQAFDTVLNIYDRRLSFVHGEHTEADMQLLERFMVMAWTFFINSIGYANKYATRDEFIRAIDNLKLSGGLK